MSSSGIFSRFGVLLRFYVAISWHHPHAGLCLSYGKVLHSYGHVPFRQLQALQSVKELEDLPVVWILATAPRTHRSGTRWIFNKAVPETLRQRLRNLLQSLV